MTGKVNIAGALHSIDTTGIVAYTDDLHDEVLNKRQSDINRELFSKIENIENGTIVPTPPTPVDPDNNPCQCITHAFMERDEYDSIEEKDSNVLYFIYGDETSGGEDNPPAVQGSVKLEEQTLITDFVIADSVLLTTGELDNNTLIL